MGKGTAVCSEREDSCMAHFRLTQLWSQAAAKVEGAGSFDPEK